LATANRSLRYLGGTIIVGAQEGKGDQRGRIAALVPLASNGE
jgi:hypothetical protein